MDKKRITQFFTDLVYFLAGSILYAVSVNVFTLPANIAPGGMTGIATVLNYLIGTPVGTVILVLNIPLLIMAAKILGTHFLTKTVIATLMSSLAIDILINILPAYRGDGLLAAIYGGVTSGIGLSLIFLRGGTTGGTDILARLIQRMLPHISLGQIILACDAVIIAASAVIYHSINSGLYAIIAIFTSTTIIDRSIYGSEMGKLIYIFSEKNPEISAAIMRDLRRGVTLLDAKGAYSGGRRDVIMCAVRKQEVSRLRRIVMELDPSAFVIVGDVGQVLGEGFNRLNTK